MPRLAARFTVFAPDLPGHALTEAPRWFEPSLPVIAAALEELVEALAIAPVVVVGHSAGAALIARMALERSIAPDLLVGLGAALVPFAGVAGAVLRPMARLLATTSKVVPLRFRGRTTVERIVRSTGSSLDAGGVDRYLALTEQPHHVSATLSMMASWDLEPLFAELPSLATPFLLIAGEHDRAVPVAQQRAVAERLGAGRLVVVEGAGHLVHEERAEAVAGAICEGVDLLEGPVKQT